MLDLIRGTAKWTQPAFQAIEEPKALMTQAEGELGFPHEDFQFDRVVHGFGWTAR
jgi:hypothetical protein